MIQQGALGFAAGLVGALTMNVFARAVVSVRGGREAPGAAPGADRTGRGMQPPQAEGTAEHDAAVKVGVLTYRIATGRRPDPRLRPWLGTAAHYAFSGSVGAFYALAAQRVPLVRAGYGTLYGALVWVVADEGVTPALGLSRGPRRLSAGVHAFALAGHLVYGATLEGAFRLLSGSDNRARAIKTGIGNWF